MLAHKASHEGRTAVEAIAGHKVAFEPAAIPAVVFTDPEIAWCGLTETQAQKENREIKVAKFPWAASGRAMTLDRTEGMTKLILDPANRAGPGRGHRGRRRGRTDRGRRARGGNGGSRQGHCSDHSPASDAFGDGHAIRRSFLRYQHRHLPAKEKLVRRRRCARCSRIQCGRERRRSRLHYNLRIMFLLLKRTLGLVICLGIVLVIVRTSSAEQILAGTATRDRSSRKQHGCRRSARPQHSQRHFVRLSSGCTIRKLFDRCPVPAIGPRATADSGRRPCFQAESSHRSLFLRRLAPNQ